MRAAFALIYRSRMRASLSFVIGSVLLTACGGQCPREAAQEEESAGDEAPVAVAPSPPAEVRALQDAPRRVSPAGTATVAFLAQGRSAFIGHLEMEPNAAVPEHQDADEEYVVVLQGHGTIVIDGVEHAVTPGSTIFMPANSTVSYQNGDERLIAIQVFAGPGSAAKYERWTPVESAPAAP